MSNTQTLIATLEGAPEIIISLVREMPPQNLKRRPGPNEWSAHEPLALEAGLEPEIIDLVRARADFDSNTDIPGFGDAEQTIVAFAREVISAEKVSSETFQNVIEHFGERGAMELAGLVGYYLFVNTTIKTFDVQLAPGREQLLPDLW